MNDDEIPLSEVDEVRIEARAHIAHLLEMLDDATRQTLTAVEAGQHVVRMKRRAEDLVTELTGAVNSLLAENGRLRAENARLRESGGG